VLTSVNTFRLSNYACSYVHSCIRTIVRCRSELDFQPLPYETKVRPGLLHQPRQQKVIEEPDDNEPGQQDQRPPHVMANDLAFIAHELGG